MYPVLCISRQDNHHGAILAPPVQGDERHLLLASIPQSKSPLKTSSSPQSKKKKKKQGLKIVGRTDKTHQDGKLMTARDQAVQNIVDGYLKQAEQTLTSPHHLPGCECCKSRNDYNSKQRGQHKKGILQQLKSRFLPVPPIGQKLPPAPTGKITLISSSPTGETASSPVQKRFRPTAFGISNLFSRMATLLRAESVQSPVLQEHFQPMQPSMELVEIPDEKVPEKVPSNQAVSKESTHVAVVPPPHQGTAEKSVYLIKNQEPFHAHVSLPAVKTMQSIPQASSHSCPVVPLSTHATPYLQSNHTYVVKPRADSSFYSLRSYILPRTPVSTISGSQKSHKTYVVRPLDSFHSQPSSCGIHQESYNSTDTFVMSDPKLKDQGSVHSTHTYELKPNEGFLQNHPSQWMPEEHLHPHFAYELAPTHREGFAATHINYQPNHTYSVTPLVLGVRPEMTDPVELPAVSTSSSSSYTSSEYSESQSDHNTHQFIVNENEYTSTQEYASGNISSKGDSSLHGESSSEMPLQHGQPSPSKTKSKRRLYIPASNSNARESSSQVRTKSDPTTKQMKKKVYFPLEDYDCPSTWSSEMSNESRFLPVQFDPLDDSRKIFKPQPKLRQTYHRHHREYHKKIEEVHKKEAKDLAAVEDKYNEAMQKLRTKIRTSFAGNPLHS